MRLIPYGLPVLSFLLLMAAVSAAVEERTVETDAGMPAGSVSDGSRPGQRPAAPVGEEEAVPVTELQSPDNTGRNRDHDLRPEAEDQSNAPADIELAAAIRRAVTDDESLSLNAHNVKIIVEAGQVTLRGPVASRAERQRVEAIARKAAGGRRPVVNELEIGGR